MSKKLLKKLKDREEKLMDAIYELKETLEAVEDAGLSSMADEFSELLIEFITENDTLTLEQIRLYIEDEMD